MRFAATLCRASLVCAAALCLPARPLLAQTDLGELRLKVVDPSGLGVKSAIELSSQANQYRGQMTTADTGMLTVARLPFGIYRVEVQRPGFAAVSQRVEIRSAVPVSLVIQLSIAPVSTTVTVSAADTLIDPHRAGTSNEIGTATIESRETSLPGRSLQDLVNSQPGWLYEGNAVLHPRGSEYQTQFVIDGIPLTDNRSPSFGPEIEADDVESMNIYTAGIPAEFGRKMGGVIEVNTLQNIRPGFHGDAVLSGGSFGTGSAFARGQYSWGGNTISGSADGSMTSRYLNPVVPQNYTNDGTTGDFSLGYERELAANDRLNLSVRHEFSRYQIPNEQVQEADGQRQYGANGETMGIVTYQHIFSSEAVGNLRGMVRDNSDDLSSNANSTPVIAFLHNDFKEGYFNGSISAHRGKQDWKMGMESDAVFLHERFQDVITNSNQFAPGTPLNFAFSGSRPDLEQAAFVEDQVRFGNWTIRGGLRWDHYQLIVNQNAVSPRLSAARYFRAANLVIHASYDRIFETPTSENLLLSSSPEVLSLNPFVLRLPVEPSHGNYYEAGLTKALFGKLRLDGNYFRRDVNHVADDDQLLSTAVSFPIAFSRGTVYGAEGKLTLPAWGRFSGYLSYSYNVGTIWFPVTGGLFLGQDAINSHTQLGGHLPDSQDQRHTLRTRFRCQMLSRLWAAAGAEYGSGLPFDFDGTAQDVLAEYGQAMLDRLNFVTLRVRPNLSVNASIGAELVKKEKYQMNLQADIENINNRLNVIDFQGLFSGNAIAPPRSYFLRLSTSF